MQVSSLNALGEAVHFEDPRSPLQKANRPFLRRFCNENGIKIDMTEPATELRKMILAAGFNFGEQIPDPEVTVASPKTEVDQKAKLESMKFFALRKMCKSFDIPYTNKNRKPELIEKILGHLA